MKPLEKLDRKVIHLLEKEKQGLQYLDILTALGMDPQRIYSSLKRLQEKGFVILSRTHYKTTPETTYKATWKAKCPACGAIRLVHNPDQGQVYCPSQDCKTPSGRPRTFWILTKRMRKKGLTIRRINCVD